MGDGAEKSDLYLSIHYLRAIAAIMVVGVHVVVYGLLPLNDERSVIWLKHGVAIFFIISGFVMVKSTEGRNISPQGFMKRRLLRIAPLYWILTTYWLCMWTGYSWSHAVASYLFLPAPGPPGGNLISPVIEPGWTLNYEMMFYLLFAATLVLPRKAQIAALVTTLMLFGLSGSVDFGNAVLNYYSNPALVEFALGLLIAYFGLRLPAWCIPLGFAGLALLSWVDAPRMLVASFPAFLIVAGARSLDGKLPNWRFLTLLGDASYAIYLSHLFVITFVVIWIMPYGMPALNAVVAMGGSIVLGIIVHFVIERPVGAMLRRILSQTWIPGRHPQVAK